LDELSPRTISEIRSNIESELDFDLTGSAIVSGHANAIKGFVWRVMKKHILITDGGAAIVRALVERFAAKRWLITIAWQHSELLYEGVSQYHDRVRAITADGGRHENREEISSEFRRALHLLVNNAAALAPVGPLLKISLGELVLPRGSEYRGSSFSYSGVVAKAGWR
jgi:NAD(P)-dependent dehydrogenase (short-subunit alcohol dehydrogenase family)